MEALKIINIQLKFNGGRIIGPGASFFKELQDHHQFYFYIYDTLICNDPLNALIFLIVIVVIVVIGIVVVIRHLVMGVLVVRFLDLGFLLRGREASRRQKRDERLEVFDGNGFRC